jgi:CheY-like chemotaxis protein
MPLVGVLEPGTVSRIVRSVRHARGDVLVLLEQDNRSGHLLFEKGELVMARLGDRLGDDVLEALEGWSTGHYSLLKRSKQEEEARAHVMLNGLNLTTRRTLERWLKRNGYATSTVGYPQHAIQVIPYIQPDVVLMHCPRGNLYLSCGELSARLREEMNGPPPLLVVVFGARDRCSEPGCVRIKPDIGELEQVLARPAEGTRLAIRQASQEHTARIYRPEPLEPRGGPPGTTEIAAQPEDRLTIGARELLPMLLVLALGSAVIWGLWWMNR